LEFIQCDELLGVFCVWVSGLCSQGVLSYLFRERKDQSEAAAEQNEQEKKRTFQKRWKLKPTVDR